MPNMAAICCSASTSTLAKAKAPLYSAASLSSNGLSALQGSHQLAQKSTRMGVVNDARITASSKLAVVTSKT